MTLSNLTLAKNLGARAHLTFMLAAALGVGGLADFAAASTIASWTFETSIPATAGPFSPEVGAGSASGSHAGAAVYSSPAGNGSAHSFSSNTWAVGDYYQFQVSSTGLQDLIISWDQTASNTGPGHFQLSYSTNGSSFTNFGSTYTVLANASPNPVWNTSTSSSIYTLTDDLSAISAIENAAAVYFRLTQVDTVSANGGTVAGGGTNRLDNVTITASPVPEPSSLVLAGLGLGVAVAVRSRRRRAR